MIAEVDVFGVFLHTGLFSALAAGLVHLGFRRVLTKANFYNWVWHRNLADLAVYVLLWGGATWVLNVVGRGAL